MKPLLRRTLRGALAATALGLIALPPPAGAQQGWSGYGGPRVAAPPATAYTYPAQGNVWQGYAPGAAWSGPAYATTAPAPATVPMQPVAVPGAGWGGYNPAAAWTGYAPAQVWTGYTPGVISVTPRQSSTRSNRGLVGWGWSEGGGYREPGTGRKIPMLKPWLPGAAGS